MKDTDFYGQVLGLVEPWEVIGVELDVAERKVEVSIGYEEGTLWACPESRERLPCHDHVERRWRHLDTCGFETVLVCRVPRVRGVDGKVWTVPVPWAEKGSRFTLLFEAFVVQVLEACQNVSAAGRLVGLSWDRLHRIMERAVERGMERRDMQGAVHLGLDEKSFARGQSYVSVMSDLEGGRVLEVMDGRDGQAGSMLLATLPDDVAQGVEAVCMDMSAAYAKAVEEELPGADIVHDRYHVSALLNKALAQVHRAENKAMLRAGDDRLKGTARLFGYSPENLSDQQAARFHAVRDAQLKSSRAWAIKESFRHFWQYSYEASARKFFARWDAWACRCRLKPVVRAARTLRRHFHRIITYIRHRITNSVAEGLNSKIQSIKANARGFRSFQNYRTRILFFCGKLNLYPL